MTRSFHEKEIGRKTNKYGGIAQVFSAYEYELTDKGQKINQRGVNSFHLIFDRGRWYVSQLIFQPETPENPIPEDLVNRETIQMESKTANTRIYFVRHAEKENDGTADPNLSEMGKASAERLSQYLGNKQVVEIYSTPYNRTTQTGEPLAKVLGKEINIYDPRDPKALQEIVRKNQGKNVLIIGHSNTVPMMINFLGKDKHLEKIPEEEYNRLFIVDLEGEDFSLQEISF